MLILSPLGDRALSGRKAVWEGQYYSVRVSTREPMAVTHHILGLQGEIVHEAVDLYETVEGN
jgi:hypothetical protein